MSNNTAPIESLPYLPSEERLKAYRLITDGCHHLWSKNKPQKDKIIALLKSIIPLTQTDPYFLAHLTSYALRKTNNKDLQVALTYVSSLSSADGTPFSPGSKYVKPNLRYVSSAALHKLDPKLAERVLDISNLKFGVPGLLNEATHLPTSLRTGLKKYLKYREAHPEYVEGIKKAGLGNVMKNLYRKTRIAPSDEVVNILRWEQKDGRSNFGERLIDFTGKTSLQIAKTIQNEKIPYLGVLAELSRVKKKITPAIAVAMLEQATGNQAVIMHATFLESGILDDAEVKKLYEKKIATAKTALDRVDRIKKIAENRESKEMLSHARAESRQKATAGLGRIYLHIDDSGSMSRIREIAQEKAAIFAECVNDPRNNFGWGLFSGQGHPLLVPDEFVKDAFAARMFGVRGGGSTNCFALYPTARKFKADVDVFFSDQENTDGNLETKIRNYHRDNPLATKPRVCVIVYFPGYYGTRRRHDIKEAYEANGIPVVEITPESLSQSALVIEEVKTALLGPVAVVDEIMNTELLELPSYYYSL